MHAAQSSFGNPPSCLTEDTETINQLSFKMVNHIITKMAGPKKEYFDDMKTEIGAECTRFLQFWVVFLEKNNQSRKCVQTIFLISEINSRKPHIFGVFLKT